MWVRVAGGREAVQGSCWSSESVAVQERRRLRRLLQGQVSGQDHLLKESSHNHCHRPVAVRTICPSKAHSL